MDPALGALTVHKSRIDGRLMEYLDGKSRQLSSVNTWGPDCIGRLKPFVVSGKSLRGGLLLESYTMFSPDISASCLDAAASLELLHAGLLIHDDIMDQDKLRRGQPSIYAQYEQFDGVSAEGREAFGVSMGINAGDLCFYLAGELLGSHPDTTALQARVSQEIQSVVIAQMQDVSGGSMDMSMSRDEILSVYRYKTARYTFSLPMAMGSVLARADTSIVSELERIGESLGILFQISDDSLSSRGDSAVSGKPVGSDERNGRRTLEKVLPPVEFERLRRSLRADAETGIRDLPVPESSKAVLTDLLRFCYERTK